MGYYVTIETDMVVPVDQFDNAYRVLCALNDDNSIKTGQRYPGIEAAPEHGPREDRWFAWMDWDYPAKCATLRDVLDHAGFGGCYIDAVGLVVGSYSDKLGDHVEFLKALGPYVKPYFDGTDPYFQINGEDDHRQRWEWDNGDWHHYVARLEWDPA